MILTKIRERGKKTILLASHEDRINHLPASPVSVLGPTDGGNKTSP